MTKEETAVDLSIAGQDKFCLYSGMRNPSDESQVSWMQYDSYSSKATAINVMRREHARSGGLWLIVRETPVAGCLPAKHVSLHV